MQIRVERFLAITAMLAGTALAVGGCVSEEETGATGGSSGSGGSGGSSASGGSAGSSGSAGSAGSTGGTAGSSGSAGSAGSAGAAGDASTECLGDTPSDPDAGVEGFDCATLPYWTASCVDAGAENALGADLCAYMADNGRIGVQEALVTCLAAIAGDPCGQTHEDGVNACVQSIFPLACESGVLPLDDGGTYDLCQAVADSCPASDAGTGGISKQQCLDSISAFTPAAQLDIANCYNTPVGTCEDDFANCVYNF